MSDNWIAWLGTTIAGIGSINWATAEFFEYDILLDLLSLDPGSTEIQALYAVIGLSGILTLYMVLVWVGLVEETNMG